MKWINCPTCLGSGELIELPTGQSVSTKDIDPETIEILRNQGRVHSCPTCTDSDGNPTGIVWVGSRAQVSTIFNAAHEGILSQRKKKNWETAEEWTQAIRPFERYLQGGE